MSCVGLYFICICAGFVVKGLVGFGDPLIYSPLLSLRLSNSVITPGMSLVAPFHGFSFSQRNIMTMVEAGLGVSILIELVLHCPHYWITLRPTIPTVNRTLAIGYRDKNSLPIASK